MKTENFTQALSDKDLDNIYEYVESCIKLNEWEVLSRIFYGFLPQVENMSIEGKLAYLISTLSVKSKIEYRQEFLDKCKELHPDDELWKGL